MQNHPKNNKLAIIITGELRVLDERHLRELESAYKDYDLFISTYKEYEEICIRLGAKYTFLEVENHGLKDQYNHSLNHVWQWAHIENIVRHFEKDLKAYEVLMKVRTDYSDNTYPGGKIEKILGDVLPQTLYVDWDYLFYGRSEHFINVFREIFSDIKKVYFGKNNDYIDINYRNLVNSNCHCIISSIHKFCLPVIVHDPNKDIGKIKRKIIANIDLLGDKEKLGKLEKVQFKNFRSDFNPFKVLAIHSLKHGIVLDSKIHKRFYDDRKSFSYLKSEV